MDKLAGKPKGCFHTFVDDISSKPVGIDESVSWGGLNWATAGAELTKCPATLATTG